MKTLYFFDLDHTLANSTHRDLAAGPMPSRHEQAAFQDWLHKWRKPGSCLKDGVYEELWPLVFALSAMPSTQCLYLSSRDEGMRGDTEEWLKRNHFPKLPLILRPHGNWQSPAELKQHQIQEMQGKSRVVVVDDDACGGLSAVCRDEGWTLLKVERGPRE